MIVSLFSLNVHALPLESGDHEYFNKVRFYHFDDVDHSVSGNVTLMSDSEYLSTIQIFYQYNLDFRNRFTMVPYSMQPVKLSYSEWNYDVIVPTMFGGSLYPTVSGDYNIIGRSSNISLPFSHGI